MINQVQKLKEMHVMNSNISQQAQHQLICLRILRLKNLIHNPLSVTTVNYYIRWCKISSKFNFSIKTQYLLSWHFEERHGYFCQTLESFTLGFQEALQRAGGKRLPVT